MLHRGLVFIDDCNFSGTYSQLDKHLKNEHRGLIPPKVDPQRQCRWEQMERHVKYVDLMSAAEIPHIPDVVHHQLPYTHHLPVFRLNIVNGTVRNIIRPVHVRN
ncbi:hypothetical protein ARALYDRAFT_916501 [Arabidopsis lyrata subsp. lyrata]|uniref:Uncharacterized protein n=1 Tax=Arabidopsis lyrata subsp. lyrata TaxID=81972 RepID=D7MJZ5_ARALL|nr:hypothetical protein ARALYDRAFT_916501 [Arabidopsis lyrata subsp. lyrata]